MNARQALSTTAARDAAEYSGNSTHADFAPDYDGRIAVVLSGFYTIDEIVAKLADLRAVQAVCDRLRNAP